MAVVRRATNKDATWARAWTADTAAELVDIPEPRRGDVAYATDTGSYYAWRDDGTWAIASDFSGAFSDLTGKPTTLSGYGITDAQAYSANLTIYSGIAPCANVQSFLGAANY